MIRHHHLELEPKIAVAPFIQDMELLRSTIIFYSVLWFFVASGSVVVHLQTDGVATDKSGLIWKHSMPVLQSFYACARVYLLQTRHTNYVFSYATEQSPNEFYMDIRYYQQEIRVGCCLDTIYETIAANISLMQWLHVCAHLDFHSKKLTLHTNEVFLTRDMLSVHTHIAPGGLLFLGQDQDHLGDGIEALHSFHGYLADVLIASGNFSFSSSKAYLNCNMKQMSQRLVSFENIEDFDIRDATKVLKEISIDPCEKAKNQFKVYRGLTNFDKATTFCKMLKGKLPLPENAEENEILHSLGKKYCPVPTLWLSAVHNVTSGSWEHPDSQMPIKYASWRGRFKGDIVAYSQMDLLGNTSEQTWGVTTPDRTLCTSCAFSSPATFRMRGFCTKTKFDQSYKQYKFVNTRPSFLGASFSQIIWIWNKTLSATNVKGFWRILSLGDPSTYADMVTTSQDRYPFGIHEWKVVGDLCGEDTVMLKFSSCELWMFTCDDGTCINKSRRCDKKSDCSDFSDEERCDIVVIPPKYNKNLPPPAPKDMFPILLNMDAIIKFTHPLQILQSKFTLELSITRFWLDSRLTFHNLQDSFSRNVVENISELWFPHVEFLGRENIISTTYEHLNHINWVLREGEPVNDSHCILDEDVVFRGQDNHLVDRREWRINALCHFDLVYYPFDTQKCPLKIKIQKYTTDLFMLKIRSLTSLSRRQDHEYELVDYFLIEETVDQRSTQTIMFVFKNQFGYYISAAYAPTTLLVLISYLTFHFDLEKFSDRITVSLTSLLVISTLFSQVAASLPKSSYLKSIDVWFLSVIVVNFSIVVSLIAIEKYRFHTVKVGHVKQITPHADSIGCKMNRVCKYFLPSIFALFLFCYCTFMVAARTL
ncbi:uncharacterized protein [Macrobrachium rosenbergii]|uniref:uncharacterized protein n=1 Tax=Macrobrachium rosenbergii TaxID=79674 RepID=UPI0034D599DA